MLYSVVIPRCIYVFLQAVIENISLKQKIFGDIEKVCPPHCILASNTSTIDLNVVGEKTKSQDRIVGAHFFRLNFSLINYRIDFINST